jgi:hypothetical protein
MPNRIKADSASGLQLISDSSDEIQIQSGSDTVAIVNSNGITMGSGKNLRQTGFYGFKAYLSSTQSISNTTNTKINFDTIGSVQGYSTVGSAYSTTNKRFTPTVEGYYQVNANVHMGSGVNGQFAYPLLYKNGTNIMYGNVIPQGAAGSILSPFAGAVHLNGSTDYIEMYWYQNAGGARSLTANEVLTFWQAHLIAQT